MHNNHNNRKTVIIPQTIPTKSIIIASLAMMSQNMNTSDKRCVGQGA